MKTLWAFEPFYQKKSAVAGMHQLLLQLCGSPEDIEVGFVVTGNESLLNISFDVPSPERFSRLPQKLIHNSLQKSGISIADKKILITENRTLSTTKAVDHLLALAKKRKSKLIGLYTQSRQGLDRWILGSFAETAVHRSRIDLLIASPYSKFSPRIKNVFFASDFTPHSKIELMKTIEICRNLDAKLTVFHGAQIIYKWSLDESNKEIKKYRLEIDRMKNWIEKTCKQKKVACKIIVDSEWDSISERALANAKNSKADLIVVAAKVGAMAALMGGSITRQLVRNGKLPVLVLKY